MCRQGKDRIPSVASGTGFFRLKEVGGAEARKGKVFGMTPLSWLYCSSLLFLAYVLMPGVVLGVGTACGEKSGCPAALVTL